MADGHVPGAGERPGRDRLDGARPEQSDEGADGPGRRVLHIDRVPGAARVPAAYGHVAGSRSSGAGQSEFSSLTIIINHALHNYANTSNKTCRYLFFAVVIY